MYSGLKDFVENAAELLGNNLISAGNILQSIAPPLGDAIGNVGGFLLGTDSMGIDKKLSNQWAEAVLNVVDREDIPGRDSWLMNRLKMHAADETHTAMLEVANGYRAQGLSRYEAQARTLGLQ